MEKLIRRNGIRRTGGIRDMFYSMCRILSGKLLHTKSFICSSITIHGRVKRIYIYFFFKLQRSLQERSFTVAIRAGQLRKSSLIPKLALPSRRPTGTAVLESFGRGDVWRACEGRDEPWLFRAIIENTRTRGRDDDDIAFALRVRNFV